MYSKANYRDKNDIIIPENYRGNAFSERIVAKESPIPPAIEEVTQSPSDETTVTVEAAETVQSKPASSTFLSSLLPPKVSNPSGLLSNIGLEEMLIVGVLILLSQSETDDDILLLLFLLLFYK